MENRHTDKHTFNEHHSCSNLTEANSYTCIKFQKPLVKSPVVNNQWKTHTHMYMHEHTHTHTCRNTHTKTHTHTDTHTLSLSQTHTQTVTCTLKKHVSRFHSWTNIKKNSLILSGANIRSKTNILQHVSHFY